MTQKREHIANIRETSKGVFRIYSASKDRWNAYVTELDTNGEGSLRLIFNAYNEGSAVDVSSWYYEKSNMSAKPEKFASYKMEIIPLVTLDSAQL